VTGAISGRTDFLIYGYILEDQRPVEASNKYKKALELKRQMLNEE